MNRYLRDVKVLIALIDPTDLQHDRAHDWFAAQGRQAWATCPLPENGVLRIVGHARYPTYLLALAAAHGGQLATFDRLLVTDAVTGGREALHLIA